nr:cysteine-rich receptor-like protein kinase [Tanacetum cinerariifolium]
MIWNERLTKKRLKGRCEIVRIDKAPGQDARVIPKGGNSSFITLIPKVPNANMVKDFRPISLIGSLYKIIAKILANRLVIVLGTLVNETRSALVADRQILDGPFILNELIQWCKKNKKQAMIFKSQTNIDTITHLLDCFHRASGLRINMIKSKLMGISVDISKVKQAAAKIGCALHGEDGKIGKKVKSTYPSIWLNIIHEVELFKLQGIDLLSFIQSMLGNGENTSFWEVAWHGDYAFKDLFPR